MVIETHLAVDASGRANKTGIALLAFINDAVSTGGVTVLSVVTAGQVHDGEAVANIASEGTRLEGGGSSVPAVGGVVVLYEGGETVLTAGRNSHTGGGSGDGANDGFGVVDNEEGGVSGGIVVGKAVGKVIALDLGGRDTDHGVSVHNGGGELYVALRVGKGLTSSHELNVDGVVGTGVSPSLTDERHGIHHALDGERYGEQSEVVLIVGAFGRTGGNDLVDHVKGFNDSLHVLGVSTGESLGHGCVEGVCHSLSDEGGVVGVAHEALELGHESTHVKNRITEHGAVVFIDCHEGLSDLGDQVGSGVTTENGQVRAGNGTDHTEELVGVLVVANVSKGLVEGSFGLRH